MIPRRGRNREILSKVGISSNAGGRRAAHAVSRVRKTLIGTGLTEFLAHRTTGADRIIEDVQQTLARGTPRRILWATETTRPG